MDKLIYGTNTNLYGTGDIKGLTKTTFREKLKQQGVDFAAWKDQLVVKLPKATLLDLLNQALIATAFKHGITQPVIHTGYYSAYNLEVSLAPPHVTQGTSLIDNEDILRVDMHLNYNEEYDYNEPESAEGSTNEVLRATTEVVGRADVVPVFCQELRRLIKDHQEAAKISLVNWVFNSDEGAREKTFAIKKTWEMDRTFYPWIETDLKSYYKSFVESRSQIMVLYGPPGTGKTSFIRDLLCEMNLNAYISYDLKILTSDSTFVNYVTGSIFDAIVIEDADDLLTAERGDANKVIAKILNVSDGLIKLPRKKLIFSTNLENVSDIDRAIIRPGRCFDVMEFRELNRDEAEAAASTLGVNITEDKKKYSLAELFYMKDLQECTDPFARKHGETLKRSIGFI